MEQVSVSSMLAPLAGGALIGLAASLVLLAHGKVAGISGILGGLFQRGVPDRAFRAAFLAGLLSAGVLLRLVSPHVFAEAAPVSLPFVALGGVLVGFGTRLGGGCTSGHGICGLARASKRSFVATMTFMATGAIAVFVVRHLFGGAP
jgi:uncharacterized protein